jgi:DNA polymerase III delta subunit
VTLFLFDSVSGRARRALQAGPKKKFSKNFQKFFLDFQTLKLSKIVQNCPSCNFFSKHDIEKLIIPSCSPYLKTDVHLLKIQVYDQGSAKRVGV